MSAEAAAWRRQRVASGRTRAALLLAAFSLLTPLAHASAQEEVPPFVDFQLLRTYPDVIRPTTLATGDVDGDGRLDVVTAWRSGGPTRLVLFRQQLDGSLLAEPLEALETEHHQGQPGLAAADFDADGLADIVSVNGPYIDFYAGTRGGLPSVRRIPVGVVGADPVLGDWEGDGDVDVFVRGLLFEDQGDRPVHQLLRNVDGVLRPDPITLPTHALVQALADLDGDGQVELIASVAAVDPRITVHTLRRDGGWDVQDVRTPTRLDYLQQLAVGDVTGDGAADVVASTYSHDRPASPYGIEVYAGVDGTLRHTAELASWQASDAVRIADLDQDGRQDVVVTHPGWDSVGLYPQLETGVLGEEELWDLPPKSSSHHERTAVAVADVDSSSTPDVVIADTNHGLVTLLQTDPPVASRLPGEPGLRRLAGADRYATAAAISADSFPGPVNHVVLATGADWPDALSAGAAAARLDAPLLTVRPGEIPPVVQGEIDRLRPRRAWIVGGPAAVSEEVLSRLTAQGITAVRVSGSTRYETSAAVARQFFPGAVSAVYASGASYADALAGGSAAARRGVPLLLTAPDRVLEATPVFGDGSLLVGGPAAVSDAVVEQLGAERRGGADRYETAVRIALADFERAAAVYLATGQDFPDALAGTPAAYREGAPLLLLRPNCAPGRVPAVVEQFRPERRIALGGTAVLQDAAASMRACG